MTREAECRRRHKDIDKDIILLLYYCTIVCYIVLFYIHDHSSWTFTSDWTHEVRGYWVRVISICKCRTHTRTTEQMHRMILSTKGVSYTKAPTCFCQITIKEPNRTVLVKQFPLLVWTRIFPRWKSFFSTDGIPTEGHRKISVVFPLNRLYFSVLKSSYMHWFQAYFHGVRRRQWFPITDSSLHLFW